jgi:hypothetical protein
MHKIAKQFWKLSEKERKLMKKYFDMRIQEFVAFLTTEVPYESLITTEYDDGDVSHGTIVINKARAELTRVYRDIFAHIYTWIIKVFIMDAYLLCRMMYYITVKQASGSTTIVYAGDAHANYYVRCLRDVFGWSPKVCKTLEMLTHEEVERCVTIEPCEDKQKARGTKKLKVSLRK